MIKFFKVCKKIICFMFGLIKKCCFELKKDKDYEEEITINLDNKICFHNYLQDKIRFSNDKKIHLYKDKKNKANKYIMFYKNAIYELVFNEKNLPYLITANSLTFKYVSNIETISNKINSFHKDEVMSKALNEDVYYKKGLGYIKNFNSVNEFKDITTKSKVYDVAINDNKLIYGYFFTTKEMGKLLKNRKKYTLDNSNTTIAKFDNKLDYKENMNYIRYMTYNLYDQIGN